MVKIFLDSADIGEMRRLAPQVDGFTTNPTLARKAGVKDYKGFALEALSLGKPVSLEVFADEFSEMAQQARILSALGRNVHVKIPVTNTRGESSSELIAELSYIGIRLNITAVMTRDQVKKLRPLLASGDIVSIFAGRIADAGNDPVKLVRYASQALTVLWASARELLNVQQAEDAGAEIITLSPELIAKLPLRGRNLREYSLETVKMFRNDALAAGYTI